MVVQIVHYRYKLKPPELIELKLKNILTWRVKRFINEQITFHIISQIFTLNIVFSTHFTSKSAWFSILGVSKWFQAFKFIRNPTRPKIDAKSFKLLTSNFIFLHLFPLYFLCSFEMLKKIGTDPNIHLFSLMNWAMSKLFINLHNFYLSLINYPEVFSWFRGNRIKVSKSSTENRDFFA